MENRKTLTRIRLCSWIFFNIVLRLNMIRYNQIWCINVNRTQMQEFLAADNLKSLILIRRKCIKDKLLEINRNFKKLVNTVKISLAMVCLTLL